MHGKKRITVNENTNKLNKLVFKNNCHQRHSCDHKKKAAMISNTNKIFPEFGDHEEETEEEKERDDKAISLKINSSEQFDYPKSEEINRSSSIICYDGRKNLNNYKQYNVEKSLKLTKSGILNKMLRSLSSSALHVKKTREEYCRQTKNYPKLNLKNCNLNSIERENETNHKKNFRKARGILFLHKKRKFNYLFGNNECHKNKQKFKKLNKATASKISSKPIISKSLDNIRFKLNEMKMSTNSTTAENQNRENLDEGSVSEMAPENLKKLEKSDYEMVILFLNNKDKEKITYSQTNNKEIIEKIMSSPEFRRHSLSKLQKDDISEKHCQNINIETVFSDGNYSPETLVTSSETVSHIVNKPSSKILKEALSNINKIPPGLEGISGIIKDSNSPYLHSLFSILNHSIRSNNSLVNNEEPQNLSNNLNTSSEMHGQNTRKCLINIDEIIEKVSTADFKGKLLDLAQPISSKDHDFVKDNKCKDIEKKINQGSENISIENDKNILTSENALHEKTKYVFQKPHNIKSERQSKSIISENENVWIKSNAYKKIIENLSNKNTLSHNLKSNDEISLKSDNEENEIKCCNGNEIIFKEYHQRNKSPLPCEIIKNDMPLKKPDLFIKSSKTSVIRIDDHDNYPSMDNFEGNKAMEDVLYSVFKKEYIPVTKSMYYSKNNKDSRTKVKLPETETAFKLTQKYSSNNQTEKLSVLNKHLADKLQHQTDNKIKMMATADNLMYNSVKKVSLNRIDWESKTQSFCQDYKNDCQKNFSGKNEITYLKELTNKTKFQESYQCAESLSFELNLLDTICTQLSRDSKKLMYNIPEEDKNESNYLEKTNVNSATSVDKILTPQENKEFIYENVYYYTKNESNTKINVSEIERNRSNYKTSFESCSAQNDYTLCNRTVNECTSDTNSKYSYDSFRSTSEFNTLLSKQFKRDYIPVCGKSVRMKNSKKNLLAYQKAEINKPCSKEDCNAYSNNEILHKDQNKNIFSRQKQNETVVNIFLSQQDKKAPKLSLDICNKNSERLKKHSSKLSVCISQDSSDEEEREDIGEEEEEEDNEDIDNENDNNDEYKNEDDGNELQKSTEMISKQFPVSARIEKKKLFPNDINNIKLTSEFVEYHTGTTLLPRIYSDFSIGNKCNPETHKYLLTK